MSRDTLRVWVPGPPVTQGSLSCYFVKTLGRCVVPQQPKVLGWRKHAQGVIAAAMLSAGIIKFTGPVRLHAQFYLKRPAAARKRLWPCKRGFDLDKGLRALMDALSNTVLDDDSQVCVVQASKGYVGGVGRLEPGVEFTVESLADEHKETT